MNKMLLKKIIKFILPILLGITAITNQIMLASDQALIIGNETKDYYVWVWAQEEPIMGTKRSPVPLDYKFFPLRPLHQSATPLSGSGISGIILGFTKKDEMKQPQSKSELIELEKDKNFRKTIAVKEIKDIYFDISGTWIPLKGCNVTITATDLVPPPHPN